MDQSMVHINRVICRRPRGSWRPLLMRVKGAKVVTGGKRSALGGTFFQPTILTDVTTEMVITEEETFGPVAPLYRFKTDAEAKAL